MAASISGLAAEIHEFDGESVQIEHPAEIILKKLIHRDSGFKPRDIFDTAVVLSSSYGDILRGQLGLVSNSKAALFDRVVGISDQYFDSVMSELDIHADLQWIVPLARRMVIEMIESIPEPEPANALEPRRGAAQELIARLHISLDDIEPEIWRRVEVPLGISLKGLHDVIQAAMPWQDYHLYQFHVDGVEYGITDPDLDPPADLKNARSVKLETLVARGAEELDYTYDFGDDWSHLVVIEAVEPAKPAVKYPRFLGGERRAPPEDVGGVPGYCNFIDAMAKGKGDRYRDAMEWYGGKFDPEEIDTLTIKLGVGAIAKRRHAGKIAYAKRLNKS